MLRLVLFLGGAAVLTGLLGLLGGCASLPEGIEPVDRFEVERYMGKWYEIARLDHSFERGLSRVSAEYTLSDNGRVRVLNRGYHAANGEWRSAKGTARLAGDDSRGFLRVSFFWPFYGSYVIFELDQEDYQYAFVTSGSKSFLWLLSRTPRPDAELLERFVARCGDLGFDTSSLIFVEHGDGGEDEAR